VRAAWEPELGPGPTRVPRRHLRIGLIGGVRFPQRPPFAGGLEAHTWTLAEGLRDRGHAVTVFGVDAPAGCDAQVVAIDWKPTEAARRDLSNRPADLVAEHHAYLHILRLLATRRVPVDVVHNNSTHHLPLAMAPLVPVPMVTTLHTPPTPWLESAFELGGGDVGHVVSVSRTNAAQWSPGTVDEVITNGVDCSLWAPDPTAVPSGAVWFGRIVPEKAPHLAIDAALRADLPIVLAGPAHDPVYFEAEIAPRLGPSVRYAGHLDAAGCAALVAGAEVCVVTPMWTEPFGFVVAEALACGTPVAAFANGAIPELLTEEVGCLAPSGDVDALADAVRRARHLDRATCRRHAVERFSLDQMVDRYEQALLRCAA